MPRALFLSLVLVTALACALPARAATVQDILARPSYDEAVYQEALRQAQEKNLAQSPYWESLVHYKTGWFTGYRSLIDDPLFFLAPDGKHNPEAELEATIQKILSRGAVDDMHAQCRFPARTQWLADELPGLAENLPEASCPRYDDVTARMAPVKATLVFPFYNMDGPGSIFGHTMLRLEKENSAPLLGYAVTYAAQADDAGPVGYIVYGLLGGFDGLYTVLPYAEKLNEYSSIESRDVWEYELNLSRKEVMRMYNHIWEMSLVRSDYFFFDENCAYNLLFFLEVARPGVLLTDGYITVIPADTIKAISRADMVAKINFRPSNTKRMQSMADMLSSAEVSMAKNIALDKTPVAEAVSLNIPNEKKAAMLDLSAELVRYYNTRVNDEQMAVYRRLSIETAMARAKLPVKNEYFVAEPGVTPEQGHETVRATAGGGYAFDSPYVELGFRPAYHSLEDNADGFLEGTNTTLGDLRLRYYTDSERLGIQRFSIMDLHNLVPRTSLFQNTSWLLSAGVEDRSVNADESFRVYYLNGGGGLTYQFGDHFMLWGALSAEAHYQEKAPYHLPFGAGPKGGAIVSAGKFGKVVLEAKHLWYTDTSEHREADLSLKYSFFPGRNHALTLEGRYLFTGNNRGEGTDIGLSYRFFF